MMRRKRKMYLNIDKIMKKPRSEWIKIYMPPRRGLKARNDALPHHFFSMPQVWHVGEITKKKALVELFPKLNL